jgi:cytoskeletal protein RodZ
MPEATDRLSGDVAELQDEMGEVQEKQIVFETRFSNGREVMAELKQDIIDLKPKAPDWLKLMLAGLSVVGILMGAQLWLTDRFNSRPTQEQMEKNIAPIKAAQKETAKDVREIEKSQSAAQTSVKNIEHTQTQQGAKIDTILERLPARRPRR